MDKQKLKTISVHVREVSKPTNPPYKFYLEIEYVEGRITFKCDNNGKLFVLSDAVHYAQIMESALNK